MESIMKSIFILHVLLELICLTTARLANDELHMLAVSPAPKGWLRNANSLFYE